MELPVMTEGKKTGLLQVTPHKNGCLCCLRMPDTGRVMRLYIFGGDEDIYLGIPEPDGKGKMTLEKSLSKLPAASCYCAEKPMAAEKKASEARVKKHVVWMGGRAYYF